jgi:NAD(P)-dependent dehydrogenase (short-subunit alcohol dehydrogenase family)
VYGAAKGGVFGLTRGLALEGAPHGIRVNAVGPGAATAAAWGTFEFTEEMIEAFKQHFPPEAVAPVVCYLAHESCTVSGALLQAASGHVAATLFANTKGVTDPGLSLERMRDTIDTVFDPSQLEVLLDPHDPGAANRDAGGMLQPKPYRPE